MAEVRDIALLDISNPIANLLKLEAEYKTTGSRLGSKVRLTLDTTQPDAALRSLEARVNALTTKARTVPVNTGTGAGVAPKLDTASITALETQIKGVAARLQNTLSLTVKLRLKGSSPLSELAANIGRAIRALEDLNVALAAGNKITTTYKVQAQAVDTTVLALARSIKQLALEQKNGLIDGAELTAQMGALRARVVELSASTTLGSRDALVLGQSYRTASAALGETAQKASPLAESIELIRVKVSALRAGYQSGMIAEQDFTTRMTALIAEGKALNVTLETDAVAFRNLALALRPGEAALQALSGQMSRLGLASQVGLAFGKSSQLISGFGNSLALIPGPLGLVAAYAQTATSALQGLTAAEIAAAAPAVALGVAIVGLVAAMSFGLHDAASFQQAMTQVAAIGGLSGAEIDKLGKHFLELSTIVPVTAEDITEFARQAETLGIHGAEGLQNYVDVMSDLKLIIRDVRGGAKGMEETGQEIVKFLRSVDSKDINADLLTTANVLVDLKTKFGAAIPNVIGLATYFSSGAKAAKATNEEILALSAALVSVGARPQSAGSSLARLFVNIQGAVNGNEKSARAWSAALDLNIDQFKKMGKESPSEVIKLFSERLAEAAAKGIPLSSIYATLGIKGQQYVRTVNELALAHDRLGEAFKTANDGAKDTTALQRRAQAATQDFNDQVKILKDTLFKVGVEIGSNLLPAATGIIKFFINAAKESENLVKYAPTVVTAIGTITAAYLLQTKAVRGLLELEALQSVNSLVGAAAGGFGRLATTVKGLPALLRGANTATSELNATMGVGGATAVGNFLKGLLAIPGAAAVVLAGLAVVAGGIAIWGQKISDDIQATYKEINDSADDQLQQLFAKVHVLEGKGKLGKLQAAQLLTINLRYNYENSDEQNAVLDKRLADLKVKIAQQQKFDAAVSKNLKSDDVSGTEAQISAYSDLESKLVDISSKYGQDKLTPFQTGVRSARIELEKMNDEIQKAIDAGKLTPEAGKSLIAQTSALQTRALHDLTQRQLDEDAKTLQGHEGDIQKGLTGLIVDARAKRSSELDQEVVDLKSKYAPQIQAALQNAQSAPKGQKASFLNEAGQLQQQQAREIVVAQRKANADLEELDRTRGVKVLEAQQKLLTEQKSGLSQRTALLEQEQQAAITTAGDSAQGQLDAARRYSPLILAAKQNELTASSQLERNQAQADLASSLHDAEGAGKRRGELELAARQLYAQRLLNIDDQASTTQEANRLASIKQVQEAEANVVKDYQSKQLADLSQYNGAQLASLVSQSQALVTKAAHDGNAPLTAAYKNIVDTVTKYQEEVLKNFRTAVAETERSIRDLSKKLAEAQPQGEKAAGERSARQPFDDIATSAGDAIKKLDDSVKGLDGNDPKNRAALLRYAHDRQTLEAQIAQAHADGNAAAAQSDLVYYSKQLQESDVAIAAQKKGEIDLGVARASLAEKQAQTDTAQLATRQRLINLASLGVQATQDAISKLPAERAAALAAIPPQQTEERVRTKRSFDQQAQQLQNELTGKQATLYDAVQSKVSLVVEQQGRSLTLDEARAKLLEAHTNETQRALVTAQQDVQLGEKALSNAQATLALLQKNGAGVAQIDAARTEVLNRQTDLVGKRETLSKTGTAFELDAQSRALVIEQARAKVLEARTPEGERALATARQDVQLSEDALGLVQQRFDLLRKTGASQSDIDAAHADVLDKEADVIGKREAERKAIDDQALNAQSQALTLDQARAKVLEAQTSERLRSLVTARQDVVLAREALDLAQQALDKARARGASKPELDGLEAGVKNAQADLLLKGQDAEKARTAVILDDQAKALALQGARNKLREAGVPLEERSLLTAQQDVAYSEQALRNAQNALALSKGGADEKSREADVLNAQTDVVSKREALEQQITAEIKRRMALALQELDVETAREKALMQLSGAASDAVANAEFDLSVTQRKIALNAQEQQQILARKHTQEELLTSQKTGLDLLAQEIEQQDKLMQAQQAKVDIQNALNASVKQLEVEASNISGTDRARADLAAADLKVKQAQETLRSAERDANTVTQVLDAQGNVITESSGETTENLQKVKAATDGLTTAMTDQRSKADALTASLRATRDAEEGLTQGGESLQRELAGGRGEAKALADALTGVSDATRKVEETTRAYHEAQSDLERSRNPTTIKAAADAEDALTSSIHAQRAAVEGLATVYREQVSSMDAVRDATDRLGKALYQGGNTQKLDYSTEVDRLDAIQQRRDGAYNALQRAISTGDNKLITQATTDLANQEDRYHKQIDLINSKFPGKNGPGGITAPGEQGIQAVFNQLDRMGITYDANTSALNKKAEIADQEAASAQKIEDSSGIFRQATDDFAQTTDKLLKQGVTIKTVVSAPPVPAVPDPRSTSPQTGPDQARTSAQAAYDQAYARVQLLNAKVYDQQGKLVYDAAKQFGGAVVDAANKALRDAAVAANLPVPPEVRSADAQRQQQLEQALKSQQAALIQYENSPQGQLQRAQKLIDAALAQRITLAPISIPPPAPRPAPALPSSNTGMAPHITNNYGDTYIDVEVNAAPGLSADQVADKVIGKLKNEARRSGRNCPP
ncbi:hypothetical protein [Deinococcus ruber]|uniref:Phage tail tape measure protein n=1 Tax=Deinococcus ruber TaxID=1848197 RepID=A0A918C9F0_9DEIO|nr:hypothetical protein [Deinococcus ruber]GGR11379.1 hypothetical protein GCM10008957_25160 [Deinococcus ruber]